ncbi:hypothetical protein [Chimaeribacter coloradensis]|uniref:hypothetical protein n=1 Tax=Chimaeribacter coloradensis TaxID=2060068 RepID=UPI0011AFCC9D|nr:hypothetical protein [Chimaeribacter coloradensis]
MPLNLDQSSITLSGTGSSDGISCSNISHLIFFTNQLNTFQKIHPISIPADNRAVDIFLRSSLLGILVTRIFRIRYHLQMPIQHYAIITATHLNPGRRDIKIISRQRRGLIFIDYHIAGQGDGVGFPLHIHAR